MIVRTLALVLALAASGCLAHERDTSDAGTDAASCAHALGPPLVHRASATACPAQRGPLATDPLCDDTDPACPTAACVTDADCTDGVNGRCGHLHHSASAAYFYCTYDECATDGDCMGGPCRCRADASSSVANECFESGNCRIDSDCGPGGYCSPSLVDRGFCACPTEDLCVDAGNGTGCFVSYDGGPQMAVNCLCGNTCAAPGWYCHTPCDECTNDSDCTGHGECLFDERRALWACTLAVCTSGP